MRQYVTIDGRRYDQHLVVTTRPIIGERIYLDGEPMAVHSISRIVDEQISPWSDLCGFELWMPLGWVVWLQPENFQGKYVEVRFTEDMRRAPS